MTLSIPTLSMRRTQILFLRGSLSFENERESVGIKPLSFSSAVSRSLKVMAGTKLKSVSSCCKGIWLQ